MTKNTFKDIHANKKDLLNNIVNEIFGFQKKLPKDLLQCPLCHMKFQQSRYVKQHMANLDCKFSNYEFAMEKSDCVEEGEEEKRKQIEKDKEEAQAQAKLFYGMSIKREPNLKLLLV